MSKSALKDIYALFIKNREVDALIFLFASILLVLISAPIPYIFGYLIDDIIPAGNKQQLIIVIAIMSGLFFIRVFLEYFNERHALQLRKSVIIELSDKMLNGIFRLNYQQRLANHSGELISRLTRDLGQLHYILPHGIAHLIYSILVSLIMIAVLIHISWELSRILLILLPFIVLVYRLFNQKLWTHSFLDADASAKKLTLLQEVIAADAEIKTYGACEQFKALALSGVRDHLHEQYLHLLINKKLNSSINLFPIISTILIWYFASLQAIDNEITIGLIVTYTSSIAIIVPALLDIVTYIAEYPNQVTVLKRIQALVNPYSPANTKDVPNIAPDKASISTLSIVNITFQYDSSNAKPLYRNTSIHFQKGTSYLIKAPNGFGKSTLFTLLTGQLSPQQGSIKINEHSISSIKALHQYITLLPQNIHLVSDTLRNNIAFGDNSISDHAILSMLQEVDLGDWLMTQEDELNTHLTHSNQQLSGGQIQRIGLARAFLRKTPILLLDEPTNNLDNNAIQCLIKLIQKASMHIICLVISHDDRIYPYLDEVVDLSTISLKSTPPSLHTEKAT